MFVMQRGELMKIAAEAFGGLLYGDVKVGLFKNDIIPTKDTILSDLEVADFTGYLAQATVSLGTEIDNVNGDAVRYFVPKLFQASGSAIANTVYGWYLFHDAATDSLVCADRFPEPIVFEDENDAVVVNPRIMIGQPGAPDTLD